ncbi:MAG: hypoxanthine-guanine phosphoribosyltransferase [Alyxoria varia]|nr:MAG: hypoxanthine-guanine phosphoribosyltransferase [Alyxoria varia]
MVEKVYVTYNQVHKLCQESADRILNDLRPNLMIAIGGGGYVPARILRSFLSRPGAPNIPIQAVGLSLYEKLPSSGSAVDNSSAAKADTDVEQPGTKVTRTQWLDLSSLEMASLIGKHILIVDEVDDTRTTLEYAVNELKKDVETARKQKGAGEEEGKTTFSIFVLHNKNKEKRGNLPEDMISQDRYLSARTVGDVWINYPWEAK